MTQEMRLSRRSLLVAAAAVPLTGCGSGYGLDYQTLKTSFGVALGVTDPPSITLEQASQVPYSSIGFRVGATQESMLILTAKTGDESLWTSAERRAFSTRFGRIVRSAGFPWNLSDSMFPSIDPVASGLQEPFPRKEILYTCDFADLSRFGVPIFARFEQRGPETITILDQPLPTIAVIEDRRCPELDWQFQNTFWIDAQTGFVWRSIQTIHPNLAPITIEMLRPSA